MESFKGQEEEIKRAEEHCKKSASPVFGRVSTTPSILKLQAVADRIKGRTTPRLQPKTKSVSSVDADIDDDYKSCNDEVPQPEATDGESSIDNSPVTLNRTWWQEPKSTALIKAHSNYDPL
jgi:hypothetical protein